jgi:hypothetical protein
MTDKKKKDGKWIQKADIKEGSFTRKAKKKGITSAQLQANVEKNPEKYDEKTRKQAQLRETLVKLSKKKKAKK